MPPDAPRPLTAPSSPSDARRVRGTGRRAARARSALTVAVNDSQLPSFDARISSAAGSKSGACLRTTVGDRLREAVLRAAHDLDRERAGKLERGFASSVCRASSGVGLGHGGLRHGRIGGPAIAGAIRVQRAGRNSRRRRPPRTCSRASADAAGGRRAAACRPAPATATASRGRTRAPNPPCRCARPGSFSSPTSRARRVGIAPPAGRPSATASSRSARAALRRRRARGPAPPCPRSPRRRASSSPPGNT